MMGLADGVGGRLLSTGERRLRRGFRFRRRRRIYWDALAVVLLVLYLNACLPQGFAVTFWPFDLGILSTATEARGFFLPKHTLPVAEVQQFFTVDNHPISEWRPQHQFVSPKHRPFHDSEVALATIIPADVDLDVFRTTYESLTSQSLQSWLWILVGQKDHLEPLHRIIGRDDRIRLAAHEYGTLSEARNIALDHLIRADAPASAFLHPYDVLELTILEKAAWTLSTIPQWQLVGFFEVIFGEERVIRHEGVHSGKLNMQQNMLPDGTVFRTRSAAGCSFIDAASDKTIFWGLWLCLANKGHWGGTLPELGSWHRQNESLGIEPFEALPDESAPIELLSPDAFPSDRTPKSVSLEPIDWSPPIRNALAPLHRKSIMIVQGWLLVGGSELGFLPIVRTFAEAGYRVTMVLTRFKHPEGLALRPRVAQYTHDIHVLPAFLRMHDFPRYIKYLIDSRGIDTVFMSNSQLIYEILPSLFELTPHTKWIDYLHNEAYDRWKWDGFPSLSLASRRYLHRTITCSQHLKDFMIERGYPADRIGVVKLGINTTEFDVIQEEDRQRVKSMLNVSSDTIIVATTARLEAQKRSWLLPDIMRHVLDKLDANDSGGRAQEVVMLVLGDGPLRAALEDRIVANDVGSNLRLLGVVDEPETVLQGTDIFLLPSAIEGISIAVAEAMAMGLPIVASQAGGLPEQLGSFGAEPPTGGILIPLIGNETEEAIGFANAVFDLAQDESKRWSMGEAAAHYVRSTFDQQTTLAGIFEERKIAGQMDNPSTADTPNPAAYFGISDMILEDRLLADMQVAQKRLAEIRTLGPAGELQAKCFFETEVERRWAQAVGTGQLCRGTKVSDAAYLFKAASEQCGAWCVWDLRVPEARGWHFNGNCFKYFDEDDRHGCRHYFSLRPSLSFKSFRLPKNSD